MDASQRYTFYRRKHRPGVPKKLQSDLAERSRRSVPKIQKGWNKPDDLKDWLFKLDNGSLGRVELRTKASISSQKLTVNRYQMDKTFSNVL
jgi:hypothetical protein